MKKLAALISLIAGVSFASDLGTSHDVVLFGAVEVAANGTNVIETTVNTTGIAKGAIVYASGAAATTTTVASVRGGTARTIATIGANNTAVQSNVTHNLYAETIRFTIVNSSTGTVATVSPGIIYEK